MTFIPHKVKVFKGYCQECAQAFGVEANVKIKVNTDLINETNYQGVEYQFEAVSLSVDNIVVLQSNKVVVTGTLDLEVTPYLEEEQFGETRAINNIVFLGLIEYPDVFPTDIVNVQDYENLKFKDASGTATTFDMENGIITLTVLANVNICVTLSQEEVVNVNAATLSLNS